MKLLHVFAMVFFSLVMWLCLLDGFLPSPNPDTHRELWKPAVTDFSTLDIRHGQWPN